MSTTCQRCGVGVAAHLPPGEDARMLKRSTGEGVCVNCAMTLWLKELEPIASILAARGPEILLDVLVRDQVARVLASSKADASPEEIDWERVVAQWSL